jgi:methylated-DNA-[protein]-cysteine S-methyltransferase
MPFTTFESPFGALMLIAGADGALRRLCFPGTAPALPETEREPERLAAATEQLDQYFRGERTRFDIALDIVAGTEFQRSVWDALQTIPYGTTTSYGALARELGAQPRAVGAAVGATPVPIVIPCHRVIGSDGSLTGYGGGLPRKRALLDMEAGVEQLALG